MVPVLRRRSAPTARATAGLARMPSETTCALHPTYAGRLSSSANSSPPAYSEAHHHRAGTSASMFMAERSQRSASASPICCAHRPFAQRYPLGRMRRLAVVGSLDGTLLIVLYLKAQRAPSARASSTRAASWHCAFLVNHPSVRGAATGAIFMKFGRAPTTWMTFIPVRPAGDAGA
jgi:hypothetical protein